MILVLQIDIFGRGDIKPNTPTNIWGQVFDRKALNKISENY